MRLPWIHGEYDADNVRHSVKVDPEPEIVIGRALIASCLMLLDPPGEALAAGIEPAEANVALTFEMVGHEFRVVVTYEGLA